MGVAPPVGPFQLTRQTLVHTRGDRFPRRICLRKGCGRDYAPRCWNQRYCQERECLRLLHRWQACQRQAKRRCKAEVKFQHAAAERERRARAKTMARPPDAGPETARGHGANDFFRRPFASGRAVMNRQPRPFVPHTLLQLHVPNRAVRSA